MSDRALQGLSTGELKRLHEASQGGFRKKGYDSSNDVSVDYDMSVNDMRKSQKINYKHYDPTEYQSELRADGTSKNAQWGKVRDSLGLKDVNSENDLNSMYRAVNNEYTQRMIDSSLAGMQAKADTPATAAPEAKAEPEARPENKIEPKVEIDKIRPFEQAVRENKSKDQISGLVGSTWNPEGGTEAPGMAEYGVAKAKAQSFQAKSKPDYSFNAGNYGGSAPEEGANYGAGTSAPPTSANSLGTDGVDAERDAQEMKNNYVQRIVTPVN